MLARRAVTLLEVMLVLSLLVILASIAWPALQRPMANHRLREAAAIVRTEWTRARVHAMSSGRIYVFLFAPAGERFSIECREDIDAAHDMPDYATTTPVQRALPAGCHFVGWRRRPDDITTANTTRVETPDSPMPLLFYPDGTTCDAVVVLENEAGRRIEVSLRGLTGTTTVGELSMAEQTPGRGATVGER